MTDAIQDPAREFGTPEALLARDDLAPTRKLELLEQWELDARRLLTAESESMGGGESAMLDRVLRARRELDSGS